MTATATSVTVTLTLAQAQLLEAVAETEAASHARAAYNSEDVESKKGHTEAAETFADAAAILDEAIDEARR